MKKYLSMTLTLIMLLCLIPTNSVLAAKEESISQLDLTVTVPVEGDKPAYDKIDGRGYYSNNGLQGVSTRIFKNGIAWFKSSTSYFSPSTTETFAANKTYTVKINLLPKGNFEFADNVTAKINGSAATVEAYDDGSILVVASLTSRKKDEVINQLDLSVTAPTEGEKPSYTKLDGVGYYSDNGLNGISTRIYKNGIAWFKSATSYISPGTTETFAGGTDYTVKIALIPKDGFKFDFSLSVKINGKAATVDHLDDGSINASVVLTATKKASVTTSKPVNTTSTVTDTTSTPAQTTSKQADTTSKTTSATAKNKEEVKESDNSVAEVTEDTTESDDSKTVGTTLNDEDNEQSNNDDKGKGKTNDNDALIWIILGILVLVIGAAVIFIALKKKKANK